MSQVYELKRHVTRMRQAGGSIDSYHNGLQGLGREIDFHYPNAMVCASDIHKWNTLLQEDRIYNDLQLQSFPTIENAYAHVQREDIRQAVMLIGTEARTGILMAS